jgi:sugar lactone lactonase YvrE
VSRNLEIALDGGSFFESPRWHGGRWWCSDFYRSAIFAFEPGSDAVQMAQVRGRPSGLGWLPDGSLLAVSMLGRQIVRVDDGGVLTVFADLSDYFPHAANDMVVTADGDIWVGSLGFDMAAGERPQAAPLVHVGRDGTTRVAANDLMIANGCVVTADGSTLIVAETLGSRLTAFTIEKEGILTDRRVWAALADAPEKGEFREMFGKLAAAPDGIALDADGCIWVADPIRNHCSRIREGGEVIETITAPAGQSVFACALGGPTGAELLVCCAPDASERRRTAARDSVLAICSVDVPAA